MGLFGIGKRGKSEAKKKDRQQDEQDRSGFVGFVLLSEPAWDKDKLIKDFWEEWGMDFSDQQEEEKDQEYKDILFIESDNMKLAISFMDAPVPHGEAEHYAAANYMWAEAVERVKEHKAQILVAVLGDEADVLERGMLFTKAVSTCLKQEHAVAVYTDGAVFQPKFYREFARMMEEGQLPIMNWVWFGIYRDEKQAGIYTYGMAKFGKDEMEVYVKPEGADLNEVRDFLLNMVSYVIENDVILRHGETIGFTAEQKLPITRSKGVALEGDTLKIGYEG